DRLLPMRPPSQRSPNAFLFAGIVAGIDVDNFLLKQPLDSLFDLNFVGTRAHTKNVLILLLAQERRFFRQRSRFHYFIRLVHWIRSANCSSALCVTKIFSKASNCSALTSDAVASFTGLMLRAD